METGWADKQRQLASHEISKIAEQREELLTGYTGRPPPLRRRYFLNSDYILSISFSPPLLERGKREKTHLAKNLRIQDELISEPCRSVYAKSGRVCV